MNIPLPWSRAVEGFLLASRAAGHSDNTLYTRKQHLQHLARRVDADPWALTRTQLVEYAAVQSWQNETRRGRYATFSAFWAWGLREGLTQHDPTRALDTIKPSPPNPLPVPDAVYLAALARADDDEQLWIDLAAEHGLRRGEIAVLHARDLLPTLVGYDIRVHGKGRKIRYVPLTQAMQRVLLDRAERGQGFLFPGDVEGHVSGRWVSKRVGRLLGDGWTIHKLRHRAAGRFWESSGHDVLVMMALMGWSNPSMVPTYVKIPSERLAEVVQASSRGRGLRSAA